MTEPLAPQYNPSSIEAQLYRWWSERDLFSPDSHAPGSGEPYVIMMPPPNVTAVLHMGHGLNNTVQDVLIRFERMRGRRALWVPGTDHAGIATQNVVERLLAREGLTRFDLGREAFVERVWAHVRQTGARILEQLQAIGCSADWSRTYFTLDEDLSHAVREVFVRLYEKDLIYRGHYIINWCPRCLTALSNEEAELEKVESHRHAVGHCYRCGTVIEPRLSEQWFVRMEPLARPALERYRDGTLQFIPERRADDYARWLEGIRDWCISRQLWWGHRIPVWYCEDERCARLSVSRTDLTACPGCGGAVRPDESVLATSFSSWLVPFTSLGWPER